tara:strand:+ start:1455 stop:2381 length:927 start_codon:yes stop_codon:yes gene_type:complete
MEKNIKKHEFNFDLTGLQTYTDQVGGLLLAEAIVKGRTADLCYVQSGIKGTQAINLLSSTLDVQDGTCGWNSSGQTTFTQRDITVCDKKVNESLCPRDLNNYWAGQFLNAGSYNESVPFEESIAKLKQEQIGKYVEEQLWRATTGTSCFNGFASLISTGTTGVVAVVGAVAITSSNALAEVDKLIELTPNAIADRDDLIVWMSMSNYRKYLINLRTANYFHFSPDSDMTEYVTFHPGTNVRVVGTHGVNTEGLYMGPAEYMVVGVDLMSDEERLDIFYSRDNDEVRVRANFKIGAQIAFPENFVTNNL